MAAAAAADARLSMLVDQIAKLAPELSPASLMAASAKIAKLSPLRVDTANVTPAASTRSRGNEESSTTLADDNTTHADGKADRQLANADNDPSQFYSAVRVGVRLNRSAAAQKSSNHWTWDASACPFEETRHSCYYINQSNADEVATRARDMMDRDASTDRLLRRFAGRDIILVGDSVMRQLAQALMCRLHRHTPALEPGHGQWSNNKWIDPTKRRHPEWSYIGYCPFTKAKHCELERGCAAFRAPPSATRTAPPPPPPPSPRPSRAARPTPPQEDASRLFRVCYVNSDKVNKGDWNAGWSMLVHAQWRSLIKGNSSCDRLNQGNASNCEKLNPRTAFFVFHSGHHSSSRELWKRWGGASPPGPPTPSPSLAALPPPTPAPSPPLSPPSLHAGSIFHSPCHSGDPALCRHAFLRLAQNHSEIIGSRHIFIECECTRAPRECKCE
jgi:hypothetical protein